MLGNLTPYLKTILTACLVFPFAAALFTLPFLILNYRKYGGIALMRVLVVYSFVLYSMCAFLLTVLPLPTRAEVAAMAPKGINWIPFTDLTVGLRKYGLLNAGALADLSKWSAFLKSKDLFQILANIVMQIPLGFYLRYYFRCSLKKTILIGFLVSLFYELTQLSGLFFIYPQAYRLCSMDDLINNTLGAAIGYGMTPLIALILPTREEIDRISYKKGEHITLIRRLFAAFLDILMLGVLAVIGYYTARCIAQREEIAYGWSFAIGFLMWFVLIPTLTGGCTPGQAILKIRVVDTDSMGRPHAFQLLARNVLLYLVEPFLLLFGMGMLAVSVITFVADGMDMMSRGVILTFCLIVLMVIVWFFLRCQLKWNEFPHGRLSCTKVVKSSELN